MKLDGVHDGRLYATAGRTVLAETDDGDGFAALGTLPAGWRSRDRLVARLAASRPFTRLVGRVVTTNVWRFTDDDLLASFGGRLFVSGDGGRSWEPTRELPPSSAVRGVLPGAVCRHEGDVYLGEYPLDGDATPRVLRSPDLGRSWETALALPDVRHVHAVQSDPHGGDLWVTTGDRDPACRVGRLRDGELDVVGGGSQRWRAVELAFTPSAVLWGMDCVYAERNELLRLDRTDLGDDRPEPETVGAVPNSVYHAATLPVDGDRWVAFSTAGESGPDSTAADAGTAGVPGQVDVVAAPASSGYADWHRVATYRRRHGVGDVVSLGGRAPRVGAYAFLTADPDRGLFVNPYNAVPGDGDVDRVPPGRLAALAGGGDRQVALDR